MKGLLTTIPDGHYEMKGFAADNARSILLAFAVFHGTQTGEGEPVPPKGATWLGLNTTDKGWHRCPFSK